MNVYMNHHVTRVNACVTQVHMNEYYMSQIPSLSTSTCVYKYAHSNMSFSLRKNIWACGQYDVYIYKGMGSK